MRWYWWIAIALVVALGGWYIFSQDEKMNDSLEKARRAKADKKLFSTLNDNENGTLRNDSEKIKSGGGESQTQGETGA